MMNINLIKQIKSRFINNFKTNPVLIFSPGRINLIGEHTDYNDGFVFPAAIDKGIITAIQKSNSDFCSVIANDINQTHQFYLNKIQPLKNGSWKNYVVGVVAEIQKKGIELDNFNIVFGGDIPNGAGLSSSAALENSIVFGLNELFQLGLSKKDMIFISQKAEHNYVGVRCGIMDQYASMFGQNNSAILLDCQDLNATVITINLDEYDILLINTNVKHSLAESEYNDRRMVCEKIASLLNIESLRFASENDLLSIKDKISEDDYQKSLYVIQENKRVLEAFEAIKNNNSELLGKLLYASHSGLQHQYKVSCPELDFLVELTKHNISILGSRMMGGGFGGCTLNIVKKEAMEHFKKETFTAFNKKFKTNCSFHSVSLSEGTRIIQEI